MEASLLTPVIPPFPPGVKNFPPQAVALFPRFLRFEVLILAPADGFA